MSLPRSDLEKIGDRLEQVEAILAYEGDNARRLAAARALLSTLDSTVMPTRSIRRHWLAAAQAVLRLNNTTATDEDVRKLDEKITALRKAIRTHQDQVAG